MQKMMRSENISDMLDTELKGFTGGLEKLGGKKGE
jgi:hypothetical protein